MRNSSALFGLTAFLGANIMRGSQRVVSSVGRAVGF
jgi:hypothetical protein